MKELSIEEKAKAYDEALEKSKRLYEQGTITESLAYIFPELKESEGESMVKFIKNQLFNIKKTVTENYELDAKLTKAIEWLEKQGEQKLPIEKLPSEMKTIGESLGFTTQEECDEYNQIVSDCIMSDTDKSEQKPADKEETKFKVGDWVVQGHNIMKIKCVGDTHYCFETVGGYVDDMLVSEIDSQFHLWTIQDAKDGDVLAEDSCIFIIQKLGDNNTAAKTYCTLYDDGDFDNGTILYFDIDSTKPATKEQRDLLFKKMKDAGYEWDVEKKELKKFDFSKPIKYNSNPPSIVKEPAWTEDDENILNDMKDTIKECWNGDTRDILLDWFETIKQRIKGEMSYEESV